MLRQEPTEKCVTHEINVYTNPHILYLQGLEITDSI